MVKNVFRKSMVIGIIILFVGASVLPSISGNVEKLDNSTNLERETKNDLILNSPKDVDWWPMFHHDLNHSGYSTSEGPETNNVKWNYTTGFYVLSSPAVANGKVYVGSADCKVYCLDGDDGTKIWDYTTGNYVCSSPAVADGKVYFGSCDDKVYCLDAGTGDLIWSYTTNYVVESSPAVYDGKVYIGSWDGRLYCLDADTGDKIWSHWGGDVSISSPAVVNGKVYIGRIETAGDGDGKVDCVDAGTGNEIWSYQTGNSVCSSPAVADGRVYFGSYDKVYCLDAGTGGLIWSYQTGHWVESSPAVADGKVYFGSADCKVYCLDADTGDEIWSYNVGATVYSSPAVADGKVYFGSHVGTHCLDANTGSLIWRYYAHFMDSSPAVVDGKVYIGSNSGKVYCFDGNYPPVANFTWTPKNPDPGETVTFNASDSYDPDPDGYIKLYEWDWDNDGSYDEIYTVSTATNSWSQSGSYPVTLRVTDNESATSKVTKAVIIGDIPPYPPEISGQTSGKPGTEYEYTFNAVDPNGDDVRYHIDWGDGKFKTTRFNSSGTDVKAKHIWYEEGTYTIKATAEDTSGLVGPEGTLTVTMPRNRVINRPFLNFLQQHPNMFPILRHLLRL